MPTKRRRRRTRTKRRLKGGWNPAWIAQVATPYIGDVVVDMTRNIILGRVERIDGNNIVANGVTYYSSGRNRGWGILKQSHLREAVEISEKNKAGVSQMPTAPVQPSKPQPSGWTFPKPQSVAKPPQAAEWQPVVQSKPKPTVTHAQIIYAPPEFAHDSDETKIVKVDITKPLNNYRFRDLNPKLLREGREYLPGEENAEEVEWATMDLINPPDREASNELGDRLDAEMRDKLATVPPHLSVLKTGMITREMIESMGDVTTPAFGDSIIREFCRMNDRPFPTTEAELCALQPKTQFPLPIPCIIECVEDIWRSISRDIRSQPNYKSNKYLIFAPGDSPSKFTTYMSLLDSFRAEFAELNVEIIQFPMSKIKNWEPAAIDAYIGPLIRQRHVGIDPSNVYFGLIDAYSQELNTVMALSYMLVRMRYPNKLAIPYKGLTRITIRILGFTHVRFGFQTEPFGPYFSSGDEFGFFSRFSPKFDETQVLIPSPDVYNCNVYILFWYTIRHIYKRTHPEIYV
jgi:hypothetical protein